VRDIVLEMVVMKIATVQIIGVVGRLRNVWNGEERVGTGFE
jgi:hypothetical protein